MQRAAVEALPKQMYVWRKSGKFTKAFNPTYSKRKMLK
jgi:hypothetical protein